MRITAILAFITALAAPVISSAGEGVPDTNTRRAYFRAESPAARRHAAPFVTRELPGGILSAAGTPAQLDALAATPGLRMIGYQSLYRPSPVVIDEMAGVPARGYAAAGETRPCELPGFLQPVGWGIKAMYDDPAHDVEMRRHAGS